MYGTYSRWQDFIAREQRTLLSFFAQYDALTIRQEKEGATTIIIAVDTRPYLVQQSYSHGIENISHYKLWAMPYSRPRHDNYVLLLRHCVRSTKATIKTCSDSESDAGEKHHHVNVKEYISAPLPDWKVPPMWCTPRGMDIIEQEGIFLIRQLLGNKTTKTNVQLRFISDRSHRDSDTAYSLSKGMMKVLNNSSEKLLTFRGVDEIQFAQEVFKAGLDAKDTESIGLDPLCPSDNDEYSDDDLTKEIDQRLLQLPPDEVGVPELIDLLVNLGGLDAESNTKLDISSSQEHRCPGSIGVSFNVLKEIAEMAFYSRASAMTPPFLPLATLNDVYRMIFVGDYVRTVERVYNVRAAKGGVVLAKSILAAMQQAADLGFNNNEADDVDTATITVYVGHDTDIDNLATALGLRWTMPPPFQYGKEQNSQMIIGTPPGSGILFTSSSSDHFQNISMSFVCPINLMEETETAFVNHKLTPVFPFDDGTVPTENKSYRTDHENATAAIVTLDYLQSRLQATLDRYPTLRPCYDRVPIVVGVENRLAQEGILIRPDSGIDASILAAWVLANVILCACILGLLIMRRAKSRTSQMDYETVKKSGDLELT
jgi:hypothetical protein